MARFRSKSACLGLKKCRKGFGGRTKYQIELAAEKMPISWLHKKRLRCHPVVQNM